MFQLTAQRMRAIDICATTEELINFSQILFHQNASLLLSLVSLMKNLKVDNAFPVVER